MQFETCKLWPGIGKFEEAKGDQFLLNSRRKLGRVVLNRSPIVQNKRLEFWQFLIGSEQREGSCYC